MKKNVMCIALATILLATTIPAFAATSTYKASYTKDKVNHYCTSNSVTKSDSEIWMQLQDVISYSKYCSKSSETVVNETGSHTTYLVSASGTRLSGAQTKEGAGTLTYSSSSVIEKANSAGSVKLQIYNPKYNSSDNVYLKTAGTLKGIAKTLEEASSVSSELDAE